MSDDYAELRKALAAGPTPGRWNSFSDSVHAADVMVASMSGWMRPSLAEKNANYIAAANPETISKLLRERDALSARLDIRWEPDEFAGAYIDEIDRLHTALDLAQSGMERACAERDGLTAAIKKQAAAAIAGMDAAHKISSHELERARRLRAESSPDALESERAANSALTGELELIRAERDALTSRSPSYDALLIISQSVAAALERAGVEECDDPGDAIDALAKDAARYRWLRKHAADVWYGDHLIELIDTGRGALDSAIDAEMAGREGEG